MGSAFDERSDEENQRNLERFTPLIYQLKKTGESNSPTHSQKCDIIGQEPGAYPYPSDDHRISSNGLEKEEPKTNLSTIQNEGACFKPKKLL